MQGTQAIAGQHAGAVWFAVVLRCCKTHRIYGPIVTARGNVFLCCKFAAVTLMLPSRQHGHFMQCQCSVTSQWAADTLNKHAMSHPVCRCCSCNGGLSWSALRQHEKLPREHTYQAPLNSTDAVKDSTQLLSRKPVPHSHCCRGAATSLSKVLLKLSLGPVCPARSEHPCSPTLQLAYMQHGPGQGAGVPAAVIAVAGLRPLHTGLGRPQPVQGLSQQGLAVPQWRAEQPTEQNAGLPQSRATAGAAAGAPRGPPGGSHLGYSLFDCQWQHHTNLVIMMMLLTQQQGVNPAATPRMYSRVHITHELQTDFRRLLVDPQDTECANAGLSDRPKQCPLDAGGA